MNDIAFPDDESQEWEQAYLDSYFIETWQTYCHVKKGYVRVQEVRQGRDCPELGYLAPFPTQGNDELMKEMRMILSR